MSEFRLKDDGPVVRSLDLTATELSYLVQVCIAEHDPHPVWLNVWKSLTDKLLNMPVGESNQ